MSPWLLAVSLTACTLTGAPDGASAPGGDVRETLPGDGAGEVGLTPEGEAALGTTAQAGRPWRRMDIDQLAASLERLTGQRWTEVSSGETVALFDRLSGSLGVPDYRSSTEEDLSPGLLFEKFLDDAATATCTAMVLDERARPAGERRFLAGLPDSLDPLADADATEAAVARAVLRFHGTRLPPGDSRVEPWVWLVQTVHADTGDVTKAWRTLCVALVTHPDFAAY